MICNVIVFLALLASVASFRGVSLARRGSLLQGNKLDGMEIEGELSPLSNNLLIRVKDIKTATQGGLFIPDNAKERPTEGLIVAAGPGRVHPETALQLDIACTVGQKVLYGQYDGTEMKYNEISHQMIKDDDVLLTYEGEEALLENVEAVKDQVLVRLPPREEANASGLITATPGAEGEAKRPNYGTVAKVGPGRQCGNGERMPIRVATGDSVRFREYGGAQIKLGTDEYIVVRAYDILAKW